MRKISARHQVVLFILLALGLVLLGCPKKPPVSEPTITKPSVTTKTQPAGPGSGQSAEDRTLGRDTEGKMAQIAALKGEDIPMKETPRKEFVEPSPAEREILKTVYFDYDKSEIKPQFRPVLEGISQWLKNNATRQILVEGHCDERGTNEYNLALGERRALSVRRYLVGLGVNPDRIHTISYGEEKPADPGHAEDAWAKNRRAEFKVSAPE